MGSDGNHPMPDSIPIKPQPNHEAVRPGQGEINRLLGVAREHGQVDVFPAKRRWPRAYWGTRLEVAVGSADASDSRQVIMHDISGGGCGFWSREKIPVGTKLRIREWSPQTQAAWLPATATHCTLGVAGYRVGAAFDQPLLTDSPGPAHEGARDPWAIVRSRARLSAPPRCTLRTRCVRTAAISSVLAVLTAILVCTRVWPDASWILVAGAASALALLCAGLLTWIQLKDDTRLLKSLLAQIQALAEGQKASVPSVKPRSQELSQIQRALANVQVSWLKSLERERRSRHKLEEVTLLKTDILNMVSHDLRTPLTSISMYARMLEDDLGTLAIEDQRRFVRIIVDECGRLSNLVDDLLEAQRLESNRVRWNIQPQDLSNTIRACGLVFQAMADSKSIDFGVECPESLSPVEADADKIAQVLSNLISNALKYTPAGGRVRVSAQPDGHDVLIGVCDNGPGIPRDQWDQIFDRFSQVPTSYMREIAGVGLGLYIVRQIVDRHGGRVWVESEVGGGSSFYVSLPGKRAGPSIDPGESPAERCGRILVCDPDPELASRIWEVLHRANFDVQVAHSGSRLLVVLDQGRTDVVISDVLLPDMNASDVLEAVHNEGQRTYGFVVHSYAGDGYEFRRRGADVFLARPASKQEVVQAVRLAMRKRNKRALVCLLLCPRRIGQILQPPLMDAGHTPILVESIKDALARCRSYPVDVLVLTDDILSSDWSDISLLQDGTEESPRIIVMSTRVSRADRRRAERMGVELVPYVADNVNTVMATILDYAATRTEGAQTCTES